MLPYGHWSKWLEEMTIASDVTRRSRVQTLVVGRPLLCGYIFYYHRVLRAWIWLCDWEKKRLRLGSRSWCSRSHINTTFWLLCSMRPTFPYSDISASYFPSPHLWHMMPWPFWPRFSPFELSAFELGGQPTLFFVTNRAASGARPLALRCVASNDNTCMTIFATVSAFSVCLCFKAKVCYSSVLGRFDKI